MIPLIKLLKVVLPVATVTTATIVTTSLISFSKKETDKDKENKDQILDDLELKAEEFKERTMLYSKDGTGDSVELKEEMKEEIMKFLKDKGNTDNLQGLGKETPDLEKLKKILDSLKNNSPENKIAPEDAQKDNQNLGDSSEVSQNQVGKQMPDTPQRDEASSEEAADLKGSQQTGDDESLKKQEQEGTGNDAEPESNLDSNHVTEQGHEGNSDNLEEIGSKDAQTEDRLASSEPKDNDSLSNGDVSDVITPETQDGNDEQKNLQGERSGEQLEAVNNLQNSDGEEGNSSSDLSVPQESNPTNEVNDNSQISSPGEENREDIKGGGENDDTRGINDGEVGGDSLNGAPKLSEDAIRELEELRDEMSDLAIRLQTLSI